MALISGLKAHKVLPLAGSNISKSQVFRMRQFTSNYKSQCATPGRQLTPVEVRYLKDELLSLHGTERQGT